MGRENLELVGGHGAQGGSQRFDHAGMGSESLDFAAALPRFHLLYIPDKISYLGVIESRFEKGSAQNGE